MIPSPAFAAMLDALKTTAGNIRSLGPAGQIEPFTPYRPWLRVVEDAIALGEADSVAAHLLDATGLADQKTEIMSRNEH